MIIYHINKATEMQTIQFLFLCEADFIPRLSSIVNINDYAKKLFTLATRFEAWEEDCLVGLVALYCNDPKIAFITSVSVDKKYRRKEIASTLLGLSINNVERKGLDFIHLEVSKENFPAIKLYKNAGFVVIESKEETIKMELVI